MISSTSSISDVATTTSAKLATANQSTQKLSFSDILAGILTSDSQGQVNEEELFSAIIEERLTSLKGEPAATAYKERFAATQNDLLTATGRMSVEDAARNSLESLIDEGVLSQTEAESIHAQAFQAAQLDDNPDALYDSFGSSFDNTVAVALVEMAIQSAAGKVASFDSGSADAGRLAFDDIQTNTAQATASSPSTNSGGSDKGLIWKPISESNGNVAVVLQPYLEGQANSVMIQDSSGKTIETVRLTSVDDIGRSIFRLKQPGGRYPDNLTVQVALKNGERLSYQIPEPANRTVF